MKRLKGNRYSFLCFVLVILLVFSLAACQKDGGQDEGLGDIEVGTESTPEPPAEPPGPSADELFAEIEQRIFLEAVTGDSYSFHSNMKNPENFGLTSIEPTWGDYYTKEYHEREIEKSKALLDELAAIDISELTSQGDRILYVILKQDAEETVKAEDYYYYDAPFSTTDGDYINIPMVMADFDFRKQDDIDTYLALMSIFGDHIDRQIAYEKEKSEQGLFMPDFVLDMVIEQAEGSIQGSINGTHYLFDTFDRRIDALDWLDDEQKNDYKESNKEVLNEFFFPAYDRIISELEALRGTGSEKLTAADKEYFLLELGFNTSSDFSPEYIIELLEAEMVRSISILYAVMTMSPEAVEAYENGELTKGSIDENMEYLKSVYPSVFPKLPDHNLDLSELPKSMQFINAGAYYMLNPVDDYVNNIIRANPASVDGNNDIMFYMAHEGYGGHLLQGVYSGANDIGNLRQIMWLICYGEGFANYGASCLLLESDFDPLVSLVSIANMNFGFALGARIEMGIYYEGWSEVEVAEVIQSFYGFSDEEMAAIEDQMRSLYESQYESKNTTIRYGLGISLFNKIRDETEERLGDDFDLLAFNTKIMEIGPCNLNTFEELMAA